MLWSLLALTLLVVAILFARAFTKERREYGRFKRMRSTTARQRMYRKWLIEGVVVLGGLAAITILAGHPFVADALRDTQEWAPIAALRELVAGGFGRGLALGALIGVVVFMFLPLVLMRGRRDEVVVVGDIQALLPRNRRELAYGAGLSINAGVSEELLFRLGLPALVFGIIGSGPIAFAAAVVVFALLHVYQGWVGVLGTTVLGLILTLAYVVSGSMLLVIVLHMLIDLRALVGIPVLMSRVHRIPGTPPSRAGSDAM